MLFGGDDDDQDFVPSYGSKLASLFGIDREPGQDDNETLTYTAPKEPKKNEDTPSAIQPQPGTPAVLIAVAVIAYKFVDDKHASQGKLGAAIIGSHSLCDYKIVLYHTKEKPVSFTRITASFSFMIQPNNYATFYDDTRQNWSIMFETEANIIQFAKQVAVAKACCSLVDGKLQSLISQDLVLGEGGTLDVGDSVEMKYTGWLFTNNSIGNMFESNSSAEKPLRFRLGRSKTIKAFDEGLFGMRKNGHRLLVVPPSAAFGSDGKPGKVPTDAITIYEVEVIRVAQNASADAVSDVSINVISTAESLESSQRDIGPKAEHPVPPAKSDKAKLISRMAKMGQSMLPPMNQPIVDSSDSPAGPGSLPSPTCHRPAGVSPKSPAHHAPTPGSPAQQLGHSAAHIMTDHSVERPPASTQAFQTMCPAFHNLPSASQIAVFQPQPFIPNMGGYHYSYNMPYNGAMFASCAGAQTVPTPAPAVPVADPNLPLMMIETRNQNTEVRISLSKISDKVDQLVDKVDAMRQHQNAALLVSTSMPSMEVSMLVPAVEKIVHENERLKKELLENRAHLESHNSKISELLQLNQMYVEQSKALLEQRNDSFKSTAFLSQSRVTALEQDKVDLSTRLSQTLTQLADTQLEMLTMKSMDAELRQTIDKLTSAESQCREELTSLRGQLAATTSELEKSKCQLREEQLRRIQLQTQVNHLEETITGLSASHKNVEKCQISQMEENLNHERKKKSDNLITCLQDKHNRQLTELTAERQTLEDRLLSLEAKYDNLRSQAVTMKQRYEERISELEVECSTPENDYKRVDIELNQALHAGRQFHLATGAMATACACSQDIPTEVKKVMNAVYRNLRAEFAADSWYSSSQINTVLLDVIKMVTLQMIHDSGNSSLSDHRHSIVASNDSIPPHSPPQTKSISPTSIELECQQPLVNDETFNDNVAPESYLERSMIQDHLVDPMSSFLMEKAAPRLDGEILTKTTDGLDFCKKNLEKPVTKPVRENENVEQEYSVVDVTTVELDFVENVENSMLETAFSKDLENVGKEGDEMEPENLGNSAADDNFQLTNITSSGHLVDCTNESSVNVLSQVNPPLVKGLKQNSDSINIGSSQDNHGQTTAELYAISGIKIIPNYSSDQTTDEILMLPEGSIPSNVSMSTRVEDVPGLTAVWTVDGAASPLSPLLDTRPSSVVSDSEQSMSTALKCGCADRDDISRDAVNRTAVASHCVPAELGMGQKDGITPGEHTPTFSKTSEPDQMLSVFGDDDDEDDDDLFSTPSKLPAFHSVSSSGGSTPKPSVAIAASDFDEKLAIKIAVDFDDDTYQKLPPLFNNDSDDDADWLG